MVLIVSFEKLFNEVVITVNLTENDPANHIHITPNNLVSGIFLLFKSQNSDRNSRQKAAKAKASLGDAEVCRLSKSYRYNQGTTLNGK